MGKSKGGKYFKPPRSRRPGGAAGPEEDGEESEDEYTAAQRGLGGQATTAGMLPPADSDEEGEGSKPAKPKETAAKGGQSQTAGQLPPNSDDDEESSEESESSDDAPINEYLSAPRQKKVVQTEERDAETIRKDLERLELIRKKREDDRKKRIADEGWDRFAPVSDTNKPPGHGVAPDHPSQK